MVSRPSPYLFCIKNEFLPKLCEHFFFFERKKQALDSIAHSGKKTEDNLLRRGFELNKLRYYKTTALNCTGSFFLLCLLWSIWLNLLATVSLSIVLKKNPFTMEKKMNEKNELLSADSLNTNNLLGTFNIGLPSEVFANLHGNRPIKIKIEMNVNKLQWKSAIAAFPSQKCFYLYSSH